MSGYYSGIPASARGCNCGTWDRLHEPGCDGTPFPTFDEDNAYDAYADQEYGL